MKKTIMTTLFGGALLLSTVAVHADGMRAELTGKNMSSSTGNIKLQDKFSQLSWDIDVNDKYGGRVMYEIKKNGQVIKTGLARNGNTNDVEKGPGNFEIVLKCNSSEAKYCLAKETHRVAMSSGK
ncbi:TPA: hypothetical protein ACTZ5W_006077 [Bacillus cereus]